MVCPHLSLRLPFFMSLVHLLRVVGFPSCFCCVLLSWVSLPPVYEFLDFVFVSVFTRFLSLFVFFCRVSCCFLVLACFSLLCVSCPCYFFLILSWFLFLFLSIVVFFLNVTCFLMKCLCCNLSRPQSASVHPSLPPSLALVYVCLLRPCLPPTNPCSLYSYPASSCYHDPPASTGAQAISHRVVMATGSSSPP